MDSLSPIHHLPIARIDAFALLRDRTALDPAALTLLQHSIATEGLRIPIEVWALSTPRNGHTHGLISGLRRFTAVRGLGHPLPRAPPHLPHPPPRPCDGGRGARPSPHRPRNPWRSRLPVGAASHCVSGSNQISNDPRFSSAAL